MFDLGDIIGAIKIKDGLFIGDQLAASDIDFISANKVTHIVNCCTRQVQNFFEKDGVAYLNYYWNDSDTQVILDSRDAAINEIFDFIEEALEEGESILVHSYIGQSRSCSVIIAYLIKKYHWSLRKCMEYMGSRRPELNIRVSFIQQLSQYEARVKSMYALSDDWNVTESTDLEEVVLKNTYMNAKSPGALGLSFTSNSTSTPSKIKWVDREMNGRYPLEQHNPNCRYSVKQKKIPSMPSSVQSAQSIENQMDTSMRSCLKGKVNFTLNLSSATTASGGDLKLSTLTEDSNDVSTKLASTSNNYFLPVEKIPHQESIESTTAPLSRLIDDEAIHGKIGKPSELKNSTKSTSSTSATSSSNAGPTPARPVSLSIFDNLASNASNPHVVSYLLGKPNGNAMTSSTPLAAPSIISPYVTSSTRGSSPTPGARPSSTGSLPNKSAVGVNSNSMLLNMSLSSAPKQSYNSTFMNFKAPSNPVSSTTRPMSPSNKGRVGTTSARPDSPSSFVRDTSKNYRLQSPSNGNRAGSAGSMNTYGQQRDPSPSKSRGSSDSFFNHFLTARRDSSRSATNNALSLTQQMQKNALLNLSSDFSFQVPVRKNNGSTLLKRAPSPTPSFNRSGSKPRWRV